MISPTLANIALDGLEKAVKEGARKGINYVRYADDFVVTGPSKEILEDSVRPIIIAFLKERGLELSLEKTKITHIDEGFDFLGFNVRKYGDKLLIKPAKKGIKNFLNSIRKTIKILCTAKTENIIRPLNDKIRGWTNYYRYCVAKATFSHVDHHIFQALWRWAKRRHQNKNALWVRKRYFCQIGLRDWRFYSKMKNGKQEIFPFLLLVAQDTYIQRHVKIKAAASPYDPDYKDYFSMRDNKMTRTR